MRSMRSYAPLMFRKSTLALFFLTGKMLTPFIKILDFLALFNTWDQAGRSSIFLSLKAKTVMCIEDKGMSKSLSSSSILGTI